MWELDVGRRRSNQWDTRGQILRDGLAFADAEHVKNLEIEVDALRMIQLISEAKSQRGCIDKCCTDFDT